MASEHPSELTCSAATEAAPQTFLIGRYQLLEKIGEGGMGEVWVARQEEPVKRKVAIKLIKAGMDSKAVLARFEQERHALALMDHPHIAKVYDAGLTENRRPFFAMELVDGLPLTKFCDERKLGIRQRLELFVSVCQAVQHAHQKGIIHRDLKPSNILVTLYDGKPAPKVIDFGVAKATGGKLSDESIATQFGAVVGTLEYMAPEQARSAPGDIDTRADIYSLGVILYELLSGLRPFDSQRLRKAAVDEMARILREEDPPRPSTRLSSEGSLPSLAAVRQIEPKKLTALMRGELDWVVMKCLEKQRDRRYETANGLARDLQRYLSDEAVEARPPNASYRLRKFMRRHKGPFLTAALVLLALIGGTVGATWQAIRATQANERATELAAEIDARRQEAEAGFAEARQAVDDYFTLVSQSRLGKFPGTQPLRRELLLKALDYYQRFAARHGDDPKYRDRLAATYTNIGQIFSDTGSITEALTWYDKGLPLWRQIMADDPDNAESAHRLANHLDLYSQALRRAGRTPEALAFEEEAVAFLTRFLDRRPGEEKLERLLGRVYSNLSLMLGTLGRAEDAIREAQKGMEVRARVLRRNPNDHLLRLYQAIAFSNLGVDWSDLGNTPDAVRAYDQARVIVEQLVQEADARPELFDHAVGADARGHLGITYYNLGNELYALDRLAEVRDYLSKCRDVQERLTRDNPTVPAHQEMLVRAYAGLADVRLLLREDAETARREAEQARDLSERLLEKDPNRTDNLELVAQSCSVLAVALARLGQRDEARAELATARTYCERRAAQAPEEIHARWAWSHHHARCAAVHREWREPAEAAAATRRMHDLWPKEPTQLVSVARQFALCIPLVGEDPEQLTAEQQAERDGYADEALAALRQAVDNGYRDAEQLKTQKDFEPLRNHPEFQKLLHELDAKPPAKTPSD